MEAGVQEMRYAQEIKRTAWTLRGASCAKSRSFENTSRAAAENLSIRRMSDQVIRRVAAVPTSFEAFVRLRPTLDPKLKGSHPLYFGPHDPPKR
jgi:hypothetical protein